MKGKIEPRHLILPKCPSGLSLESSEEVKDEVNIQENDFNDLKSEVKNNFQINREKNFCMRNKIQENMELTLTR